jgi:ABC-2 type transport system permease protein
VLRGLLVFARKEGHELVRTWRIWVLPSIVLFFAVTGPLLARFTPELIGALAGNQLRGLKIPSSTYSDAYMQWIKNLSQIVLIAVIIVYAGVVSAEVRNGTAALVLTKPLSRTAFVIAKVAVQSLFLVGVVSVGGLVTWTLTWLIFRQAPGAALWTATGTFLVLGLVFVAVMTLLSVLIRSTAGAAGAGLGVYVVLVIAAIWKPLGTYSPAALTSLPGSLAIGKDVSALWPLLTSALLMPMLVAIAAGLFRRQDL